MSAVSESPARCVSVACSKEGRWSIAACIKSIWPMVGRLARRLATRIGVWVEDYEAPDHMYLHLGHACGAHTMIEISFSYGATAKEPRRHFQYELIGTDGVLRYNREEHTCELRNSHGTQWLSWHPEKNFAGMYAEFAHCLATGEPRNMPTADDGLIATQIARAATAQAIADREASSGSHRSTLARADKRGTAAIKGVQADSDDQIAWFSAEATIPPLAMLP